MSAKCGLILFILLIAPSIESGKSLFTFIFYFYTVTIDAQTDNEKTKLLFSFHDNERTTELKHFGKMVNANDSIFFIVFIYWKIFFIKFKGNLLISHAIIHTKVVTTKPTIKTQNKNKSLFSSSVGTMAITPFKSLNRKKNVPTSHNQSFRSRLIIKKNVYKTRKGAFLYLSARKLSQQPHYKRIEVMA